MNFIFRIVPRTALLVVATSLGACSQHSPAPAAPDGGDAQRLVALLDYVGGDYALAVRDGVVVSPAEYEEQVAFTDDARRLAAGLLGSGAAASDRLLAQLDEVRARVAARASPAEV